MENIVYAVGKEKPVFVIEDRGYKCKAWYLSEPKDEALVQIFKKGKLIRELLFPAYKIYNIAAHLKDIVDNEIKDSDLGYKQAAWDGVNPI